MPDTELPSYPDNSIRGEIILGLKDPLIMSEAEFNSSPDLLYHGAAKPFMYSPLGEFDPNDTGSDNWHDYGTGFYATDNLNQARNYSLERASQESNTPAVYAFLPHEARMLDVRSVNDPDRNGTLPKAFTEEWLDYLERFLNNDDNFSIFNEFLREVYQDGTRESYLERVRKALEGNKTIYIRSGERPDSTGLLKTTGNGFVAPIFRDFMLSEGYGGMIYREGGEGKGGENLTGYVFYNPRVLDTWEGWQKRKEAT